MKRWLKNYMDLTLMKMSKNHGQGEKYRYRKKPMIVIFH